MKLLARIGAPFAWKVVRQHDGYTCFENSITGQRQLPLAVIQATSLLVALLVPISADARLGIPDALGVLRAAMIPFELPEPFFLVPRDLPLPPVIRVKSLRLCPPSVPKDSFAQSIGGRSD
jgi:hypothetical protein